MADDIPARARIDAHAVARAASVLRSGGLVAFPTETVYGLGADATDADAIARLYEAKGRPSFNPLIIHVADPADAEPFAEVGTQARRAIGFFWPGPLTLVLRAKPDGPVVPLARAGLETVAVRCPALDVARDLVRAAGRPIAAPSANRSNGLSPTTAEHVRRSLGGVVELVLDGGPTTVGVESTVVDLTGSAPRLLRPGGLSREALVAVLGEMRGAGTGPVMGPGMLRRHYAPSSPLRLRAGEVRPGEALLAFGEPLETSGPMLNLSREGNTTAAAANLFRHLHELDALRPAGIAVMPIPDQGLGLAVNDRLRRAAARD